MYHPDWFYGLLPPGWVDRPWEFDVYERNVLPLAAGGSMTVENIFSKVCDTLVFGGAVLVTLTTDATILCPLSGVSTGIVARLYTPASGAIYTAGFDGSSNPTGGFVPLENLFAVWQVPGQRPVYWPIPIVVPVGGSLAMDLTDVRGASSNNLRFSFSTACVEPADRIAA